MSVQSIVGTPINPSIGITNSEGSSARAGRLDSAVSFNGAKDRFIKKPAKNDASQTMTPSMQAEQSTKKQKRAKILSSVILLLGGAMLAYGHRSHIEKGINAVKGKVSEFISKGKPAEIIEKGKEFLSKAKDAIFVKQPTV